LEGVLGAKLDQSISADICIDVQVPQQFSIPVLGGEDQPSSSVSTATLPSAEPVEVTHTQPAKGAAEPARASNSAYAEPSIAAVPFPNFVPSLQEAAEPAQAANSAAAESSEAAGSAAAEPSIAAMPFPNVVATLKEYKRQADETPVKTDSAAAPAEPKPASAPAVTAEVRSQPTHHVFVSTALQHYCVIACMVLQCTDVYASNALLLM